MAKQKSRAKVVQAREDRRAFLTFLTMLLAFLTSVVNMVTGALNFSTARHGRPVTRIVSARGTASGRATVTGVGESITGTLSAHLEPLRVSASGTVSNLPAPDEQIA